MQNWAENKDSLEELISGKSQEKRVGKECIKRIENRARCSLQELHWYIYMHSGRGFLLNKRQRRTFLEQVSMCRQAAYLMKQTDWGRNPYIVASCSMQFSFLTSCLLKFGKPLCYHLISFWRSSKYYHEHRTELWAQNRFSTRSMGAHGPAVKEEAGVSRCVATSDIAGDMYIQHGLLNIL